MKKQRWMLITSAIILVLETAVGIAVYMSGVQTLLGDELLKQQTVEAMVRFVVQPSVALRVGLVYWQPFTLLGFVFIINLWWIFWLLGERPKY